MSVETPETPKAPPYKIRSIGSAVDHLFELRERRREADAAVDKIKAEMAAVEEAIMARMDTEGTRKGEGKKAGVSISSVVTAKIADDEKFFAYVKKTGYFHLFQRRLSDPACRELFDSKGSIPGVEPFPVRRLNLRVLST